jgi:hypothetical protein
LAKPLITVVETPTFLATAKAAGMSEDERKALIDHVAAHPEAGEVVVGSGGCRKVRFAKAGRGKSGGYRVMSLFGNDQMPVYLLAVLSKGSAANFSAAQIAQMAVLAKKIIANHRPKERPHGGRL